MLVMFSFTDNSCMWRILFKISACLAFLIWSQVASANDRHVTDRLIATIAFGSCANQDLPQPIWEDVLEKRPEVFAFLGDNIYAMQFSREAAAAAYAKLNSVAAFAALRRSALILPVWDDNDYGSPDGGREHPQKLEAKELFLDFFEVPSHDRRRMREGVYFSKTLGPPGQQVQFIMLDTRYFRDPLLSDGHAYRPNLDRNATLLGSAQWRWLKAELKEPAAVRVIASSIQVIPDEHRFEKWGNFPHERERLLNLIDRSSSGTSIIISGDRHHAEVSRLQLSKRTLYEITSSALNMTREDGAESNRFRVGERYMRPNFGMLSIDWSAVGPSISARIIGHGHGVVLSEQLQP